MLLQMSTASHDAKHYSQNVCDYSDAPAETRSTNHELKPSHRTIKKTSEDKKNKQAIILPHVSLQSKWLIVDYFRSCKVQRNERSNSNQMWRRRPHARFNLFASAGTHWHNYRTFLLCEMNIQQRKRNVISPTNSGVPKMFLNSFPALI